MYSTYLAYLIAFLGLVLIVRGVWGFLYIQGEPRPIAEKNYAMMVLMIGLGFAMGGIAQTLRLLVAIAHVIQPH